jgi:D-alanyl-D-alanine carboxypeptidase
MLKKVLIGLAGLAAVAGVIITTVYFNFAPDEHRILNFIEENPERAAIQLVRNDSVLAVSNPDKMMPLASTVKIIIAIEYAKQATSGYIDADREIRVSELNNYYVPNTDGGAHPAWLKSLDKKEDDLVQIRDIARGMIVYSSNANTEWLSEKLGLENINKRLDSLGVQNHSEIYYIVSSLFVGKERFPKLRAVELEDSLQKLSIEEYIQITDEIHTKLKADTTYKNDLGDLGLNIQKVWSDNLPASTVSEYVNIMSKINSRTYFSEATHQYLDEVLETLMDNPLNREWLEHTGMKGGSTAFVLTKALYATDKEGNTTELTYYLNDLEGLENARLQLSMNEFELQVLTNQEFRATIQEVLGN